VQVKDGEGWKRTYIRTGLSDGINLELLGGVDANTELKGAKKEEAPEEASYGGGE
jgi:hypothetical protein